MAYFDQIEPINEIFDHSYDVNKSGWNDFCTISKKKFLSDPKMLTYERHFFPKMPPISPTMIYFGQVYPH